MSTTRSPFRSTTFLLALALVVPALATLVALPLVKPAVPHHWQAPPVLVESYVTLGLAPPEYVWSAMPDLVVYADGRVFMSKTAGSGRRHMTMTQLTQPDICKLLTGIEADGFFDFDPRTYVRPNMTDHDTTHITVETWHRRTVSAYALDSMKGWGTTFIGGGWVPPSLLATYRRLTAYAPSSSTAYEPERVMLRVEARTCESCERTAEPWPLSSPALAELAARPDAADHGILLQGDEVHRIAALFGEQWIRYYTENGTSYAVAMRPLLPYEVFDLSWGRKPYSYEMEPATDMQCPSP